MTEKDDLQREKPRKKPLDLARCIKFILLILLVLLLVGQLTTGEFGKLVERNVFSWLILLIKLLLIGLLIWLIRVQRRLFCKITEPNGCTEEDINQPIPGLSVKAVGNAYGAAFGHYTLEWRKAAGQSCQDNADWSSVGVTYPGGTGTGFSPVISGTLGWIDTTVWPSGTYEVRLCVYSFHPGGFRKCCCTQFTLFKQLVYIERVAETPGAPVQTPPGPFAPDAPIVDKNPGGTVVPVGGCVHVKGSAWVGECNTRKIKCFDLRYAKGFLPGPKAPGFNPADYTGPDTGSLLNSKVCYTPPDESQKRAQWNQVIGRDLTTELVKTQIDFFGSTIDIWKLRDFCFNSAAKLPDCADANHHCHSGKYTLLLEVEDTFGNKYYDTQHVWFDNKPIHVKFTGIEGLKSCTGLNLDKGGFLPKGAPCDQPWPINLKGIVYDEYVDEADTSYPSNNFDYYTLYITRQGGPIYYVPITFNLTLPLGPEPLKGKSRVGEPGTRCESSISGCTPVVSPIPPEAADILTQLDLRVFDAECASHLSGLFAPPAGFALDRETCCGYTFQIFACDKTWSDGWAGAYHHKWSDPWAVCICNDLPKKK